MGNWMCDEIRSKGMSHVIQNVDLHEVVRVFFHIIDFWRMRDDDVCA